MEAAFQTAQNLDDGLAQFKASHLGECLCIYSNDGLCVILIQSEYPWHEIIINTYFNPLLQFQYLYLTLSLLAKVVS